MMVVQRTGCRLCAACRPVHTPSTMLRTGTARNMHAQMLSRLYAYVDFGNHG